MLALAQIKAHDRNIPKSIETHIQALVTASTLNAKVVVFPEMSLTGYDLAYAAQHPFKGVDDTRLRPLLNMVKKLAITAIVGCVLKQQDKLYIAALILCPQGKNSIYLKQNLHDGEAAYVSSGTKPISHNVEGLKFSFGICADFYQPEQLLSESASNPDILILAVLISQLGFAKDIEILKNISKSVPLAFVNYTGTTGGWNACGTSSIVCNGKVSFSAPKEVEGLLLMESNGNSRFFKLDPF
ncbi:carbon-nitrogen hydrolase family protein [Pseudoalteromonas sp. A25]|uniref:carbon-nitrogen hydrolase family protein n=1 Tax=Pseudoalteromonas sp. A25 TaxID=116092 RepID=UPI001260B160|nr:carbon-nitrogen hydrolase family protein [Pseudoalteromonas sp. A25]BBN81056.1 carbon-nitrogen hydrolase family protein [Pseudoalteromonas sp. A25]